MKKSAFIYQLITIIIFLVFIVLPLFQGITHVFTLQKLESENKAAAKFPALNLKRLDPFPPQFTTFYNENFPFREVFFQFDYRILFKKSPVKEVIIGKEKWLFSAKNGNIYQGLTSFSDKKIQLAVQNLEERKKKYEARGTKFYFVIVPTSYEIYSEYLPNYIFRTKKTVTDKFREELQNTDISFIYLKEELLKNKPEGQLYRKNDHHWSELGGYFAYRTIIDLIKKDFPQIPLYTLTDFEMKPNHTKAGNLISMLNDSFKELFDEDIWYEVTLKDSSKIWHEVEKVGYPCIKNFPYPWEYERGGETPFKELPNIVIIRDSYFDGMKPFFFNSFSRSVAIFDNWKYRENMDVVTQEDAKIVLLILTEANIASLINFN
jgi:hypothetical protein